jgi:hypothetical protein
MGYEIARIEIQCFRNGTTIRGISQIKRYNAPERGEVWFPVNGSKGIAITPISPNQLRFDQDCVYIRVTPISNVADGIFTSDIDFRLSLENVYDVFGKSLERFVARAWEMFASEEHQEDWRAYAFMTVYENNENNEGTPTFRGYIPLDENLLTIAIDPTRVA